MAFHVACPLTCRKICSCTLGASGRLRKLGGSDAFLRNAMALQKLLTKSPLMVTTGEDTVEVLVPRLSKDVKKKKKKAAAAEAGADEAEGEAPAAENEVPAAPEAEELKAEPESVEEQSSQQVTKAEEDAPDHPLVEDEVEAASLSPHEEEASVPPVEQVLCGLCSQPESFGSRRYERMLTCEGCQRRFHRKCMKQWAAHRDLFNWASWRCAYCRTCEDCKVTGDTNRLLFCKRCDEAHHNNCKQTAAKVPARGPYLCPKHTQCHSCGTHVPGGGSSSRWFHCHLFCDACGRLFVKDKYCPVCLKVYRETEPTPMVCCDICEHWVHCVCEGITDEKYQEYQAKSNLRFTCAACRGECFQTTSVEDAIVELWRRKDEAERDQIATMRAAAGLPSESEMAKLCPSSEDEQPSTAVKDSSKKEGKYVIKIVKKSAPDQRTASSSKAQKKSGGKSKITTDEDGVSAEATDGGKSQELDETSSRHKKSKKKKQGPEDEKAVATHTVKLKAPPLNPSEVGKPATKITLHVPARKVEMREETSASEETKDDEMGEQQSDEFAGQHSESRRKRVPSSKYRDMDTSGTPASKSSGDVSRKKARTEPVEVETEKKPLKLKFRKHAVVEGEQSATRGHRSKRKRPSNLQEEDAAGEEVDSDEDDTSILQRLGVDAVTKRVEVCRASDKTWLKGTITAVNQRRSQFTIDFDNGEKRTQKYGKEKVRLLGKR